MGASSSKADNANAENANSNRMSMEIVLDKGVKQQIDRLSEYVSFFNKNDVDSLLSVVDTYASDLKTSTGQTYQLSNIKRFVAKFHEELLEKITKDSPNLTAEEKKAQLGEKLKDSKLPDILKTTYDERLSKLKTEILGSPLVVKDRQMGQSIDRIFTDITGIKSKYKYFEYRYIQLNLFLIVFIQHVFSTMDKFINSVLAYTVTRDRTRQDSLRQLIDLLLEIMRQAELNIDQKDFEAIDKLMSVVETEIKQKQKNLGEAVDKARVEALDEMLKLVVANHDMFADQAAQGMTNPESTDDFVNSFSMRLNKAPSNLSVASPTVNQVGEQGFGLASTNSRPGRTNDPFAPNTRMGKPPGEGLVAYGGFVRDHSRFPQAFFELNSSS
jgi:hypothetical protein